MITFIDSLILMFRLYAAYILSESHTVMNISLGQSLWMPKTGLGTRDSLPPLLLPLTLGPQPASSGTKLSYQKAECPEVLLI